MLVTGAGPTSPGTPTLDPPLGGTTKFHPFESITFTWTAVAGAATYTFEVANASLPQFPVLTTRVHQDNIVGTTTQTTIADFCNGCEQGNYLARVYAVSAAGSGASRRRRSRSASSTTIRCRHRRTRSRRSAE